MKKYVILFGLFCACVIFIIGFTGCATKEEAVKEDVQQPKEEVAEEVKKEVKKEVKEEVAKEEKPAEVVVEEEKEMEVVQRIDSDGDGVYDDEDQCADSPPGAMVDEYGCPKDSDRDGVYDGLDRCPDTISGVPVDRMGCPTITPSGEVARYKVVFEFDSDCASLKPIYYIRYKEQVEAIIKSNPYLEVLRVDVEGYTDRTGSDKYNLELSSRRARSVKMFLISQFGIDDSIITTQAFGERRPIASNSTAEGRQKNRRVEVFITVKNTEE